MFLLDKFPSKYSLQYLFELLWLCIKPRIQEQGTECGERGEWGECYIAGNVAKHFGGCHQTFRKISSNIPGNVLKHSGERRQKFRGISPQTFRGISPNIPGNVVKHFGECSQTIQRKV